MVEAGAKPLFTVGHSNHTIEHFITLLRRHGVDTVADVRSRPFSRFVPHFTKRNFAALLAGEGVTYLHLGAELGGRPVTTDVPVARLDYRQRIRTPAFQAGIERLLATHQRTALVCRERDPLDCHRTHLVCRYVKAMVGPIHHILPDGSIEPHATTERRLLERSAMVELPLFSQIDALSEAERLEAAHDRWWQGSGP